MPAMNWAKPPQATAMPTTTLGVAICRTWVLYIDSMKVVDAKERSPLCNALVIRRIKSEMNES
jgi:hypothetical protein